MNVLTIPRAVAGAEYTALRYPLTLLEKRVFARYLEQDAPLRLSFERALGTLDSTVGRALADPDLTRRGSVLARRSDVLAKAVKLEEKAAQRKEQANASLKTAKSTAERKRADAKQRAQTEAKALQEHQQAEKRAAEQRAQATAEAKVRAVEQQAEATIEAEQQKLDEQLSTIEATADRRTAKPKAELKEASQLKADAARERQTADRLADLASDERDRRKSG